MPNKMLIDATHPEETRVVVVRGNRVEEFDFESAQRKQLRGNIYLAKVTRVEPSLQAAFIEYGGNRHGFLAFSEIHPDYYQIPVADRQALIEADERAHREAEEETDNRSNRRRSRHRNARRRGGNGDRVRSAVVEDGAGDLASTPQPFEDGSHAEHAPDNHSHDASGDAAGEHAAHPDDHGDHGHQPGDHEHDHNDQADGHHDDQRHEDEGAAPDEAGRHDDDAASEASVVPASDAGHDARASDHPHEHQVSTYEAGSIAPDRDDETTEHHADDHSSHESETHGDAQADGDDDEDDDPDQEVESVGGNDVMEEVPERAFRPRRQYKIQEVIKRRQVMLVQVVKEERGNKGAALTTYLSLAGRYAVLMPNTARGGGISRKITSAQDRSRLKEVVQDLDVPEGMGIILRTAGASRTKPEIKRDFEYLIRMWETVRDLTLRSQAPTLVYEEGSLIKRSLRDLYNKEIDEIQVAGDAGYTEARDFMKMLMPTNVRAVKSYRDGQPLFSRMGVESQLDAMFSPTVQLRSGGYLVINQTEALVSIDVNSGRSTREHHIEDTALKTNLEAAEEVARQLRLRDLAGLIVIDFIDMDEKRNNRAVERKLGDCLRHDRARIQVGRISHFGLLEMSRQRIRASVLESSTEPCVHCGGSGHVRSVASVALQLLRGLEEALMKGATHNMVVRTRTDVALYVLNHKRGHLRNLEEGFKVALSVIADPQVSGSQSFLIDRGEQVHTLEAAKALLATQLAIHPAQDEQDAEDEPLDIETESEIETDETEAIADDASGEKAETDNDGRRRRRRRRRGRNGEGREGESHDGESAGADVKTSAEAGEASATSESVDDTPDAGSDDEHHAEGDPTSANDRRPRRRGRRGGRRRRGPAEAGLAASIGDELEPAETPEATAAVADLGDNVAQETLNHWTPEPATPPEPEPAHAPPATAGHAETAQPSAAPSDDDRSAKRRSTVREKVSFAPSAAAASPPESPSGNSASPDSAHTTQPEEAAAPDDGAPRRGWWSRRFGNS